MAYHSAFYQVPLNRSEITQAELNIENKTRSNPLKWNGQFSPQLIETLLKTYAPPKAKIFDPFLGSGTVLLEAGILGLPAYGTEINPAAFVLAGVYRFINITLEERKAVLRKVLGILESAFPYRLLQNPLSPDAVKSSLLNTLLYTALTELEISLLHLLITMADFYQSELSESKIFSIWQKISGHVLKLPVSFEPIEIFLSDARKTPLAIHAIDLVVTSPPYINVFNYHQQYRASLEALGWNLLEVAKSEIGSNRKHRGNRFVTVIQYCLDMALVFAELWRVCKPNTHLIFVVGRESSVRGVPFYNGAIVTAVAYNAFNFHLKMRQERCFQNRFGQNIYEDILHFSQAKTKPHTTVLAQARQVALSVLEDSFDKAASEVRSDIESAIDQIESVQPSPILNINQPAPKEIQ